MIMPTRVIKPIDALIYISSEILSLLVSGELKIDELYEKLNNSYSKKISFEKFILSLDFLYVLDKVVIENEIVKIIL